MPTKVLNRQSFLQLVSVADHDMRTALIYQLAQDLQRCHDMLREEYENLISHKSQSLAATRRATHEMKGLASTLEVESLARACVEIEGFCDHADFNALTQKLPQALSVNQQLRAEILSMVDHAA